MRFDVSRALIAVSACLALVLTLAPAASAQTAGDWQPGPGAILDNTYAGVIDLPSNGATVPANGSFPLSGWFVDTTAEGWAGADNVQLWLGTMDGSGRMIAQALFAQPRPDVAAALGNPFDAASGFGASVQGSSVPAGGQTLYLYAHTPGKGWWFKTVDVTGGGSAPAAAAPAPVAATGGGAPTVTVTSPTEAQNVNASGGRTFTITGTASDPAGALDSVDVWIFGERGSDRGTDLGQADLNGNNWSLSFTPTKFPSTHTNIFVYAHSRATGQTTETLRGFNIVG